jgi:hypothetical protein
LPVLPHLPSQCLGASLAMADPPDTNRYPEVVLEMEPGDLSFHNTNTIHRTGRNLSDGHRRNLGFMYRTTRALKNEAARDDAVARLEQATGGGGDKPMGMGRKGDSRWGQMRSDKPRL